MMVTLTLTRTMPMATMTVTMITTTIVTTPSTTHREPCQTTLKAFARRYAAFAITRRRLKTSRRGSQTSTNVRYELLIASTFNVVISLLRPGYCHSPTGVPSVAHARACSTNANGCAVSVRGHTAGSSKRSRQVFEQIASRRRNVSGSRSHGPGPSTTPATAPRCVSTYRRRRRGGMNRTCWPARPPPRNSPRSPSRCRQTAPAETAALQLPGWPLARKGLSSSATASFRRQRTLFAVAQVLPRKQIMRGLVKALVRALSHEIERRIDMHFARATVQDSVHFAFDAPQDSAQMRRRLRDRAWAQERLWRLFKIGRRQDVRHRRRQTPVGVRLAQQPLGQPRDSPMAVEIFKHSTPFPRLAVE